MSELKITDSKLINKIRTDAFMNQIYNNAKQSGLTELEMLTSAVIILLNLKEEAFQEKVDEVMRSPQPLTCFSSIYAEQLNNKDKQ